MNEAAIGIRDLFLSTVRQVQTVFCHVLLELTASQRPARQSGFTAGRSTCTTDGTTATARTASAA